MFIRACAALVLSLLAAGLGVADETRKLLCATQLRQLWLNQLLLKSKGKGPSTSTGAKFWTDLQPHLKEQDQELLVCPLSGKKPAQGVTTYRGPIRELSTVGRDDAVGACSGHHADGSLTVIWKNGAVELLNKGDARLKAVLEATGD